MCVTVDDVDKFVKSWDTRDIDVIYAANWEMNQTLMVQDA